MYYMYTQASSQGGWYIGSEEPPSQRKVHYLVMNGPKSQPFKTKGPDHYYNYTIQGRS